MTGREYPDLDLGTRAERAAHEVPAAAACPYCAGRHLGKCYLVRAIEYYENGSLRRVEFYNPDEIMSATAAVIATRNGGVPPRLFVGGEFIAHSGGKLPFKIDCDALSDGDLETLAAEAAQVLPRFSVAHGVPRGGMRFSGALLRYRTASPFDPVLIVDDVLTTGASMERARAGLGPNTIGVVIFARGPCPDWVTPLFTYREG